MLLILLFDFSVGFFSGKLSARTMVAPCQWSLKIAMSPLGSEIIELGEAVRVIGKSSEVGSGKVVRLEKDGTYRIQLSNSDEQMSLPRKRLTRDERGGATPTVAAIFDTKSFRRLCKLHCTKDDAVLEIGCSYGDASKEILSAKPKRFVGLDNSFECVAHCQSLGMGDESRHRFERVDCLEDRAKLIAIMDAEKPTLIAVDIAGVRILPHVMELIEVVSTTTTTTTTTTTLTLSHSLVRWSAHMPPKRL